VRRVDHGQEQLLLALEVLVQQSLAHTSTVCDRHRARRLVAVGGEHRPGAGQDLISAGLGVGAFDYGTRRGTGGVDG
jgi:hypothetical protein